MSLARKYAVPDELALLYEFLNSIDLRSYVEKGVAHEPSDELATLGECEAWLRARHLLGREEELTAAEYESALELRAALRSYVQLAGEERADCRARVSRLNRASSAYPLVLRVARGGSVSLQPDADGNKLGRVVAEFFGLAQSGRLERLKACGSDECQWVFFDRSKPGNRRWCSSVLCGNRQKTRAYRDRSRAILEDA